MNSLKVANGQKEGLLRSPVGARKQIVYRAKAAGGAVLLHTAFCKNHRQPFDVISLTIYTAAGQKKFVIGAVDSDHCWASQAAF